MFQGSFDLETATPVDAGAISDVLFERGLYWASGRSGVVNLIAAHKWFNLAALKGRVDAIALRGRDRHRPTRSPRLDDGALAQTRSSPFSKPEQGARPARPEGRRRMVSRPSPCATLAVFRDRQIACALS